MPECGDSSFNANYEEVWTKYAVPESANNVQDYFQPSQCEKYLVNATIVNGTCFKELFTRDVVQCNEWVFDEERTIVNEVINSFVHLFYFFYNILTIALLTVEHHLLGKPMETLFNRHKPFCWNYRWFGILWLLSRQVINRAKCERSQKMLKIRTIVLFFFLW